MNEVIKESIYNKVIELLPGDKTILVLDAGCGSGVLSKKLLQQGYKNIIALDKENTLEIKIPFKKLDLNKNLPFEKETFDLIICQETIEHLENPRHTIREFKRILTQQGVIIITTPNIFNWRARMYYPLKKIIWGFREEDYNISGHITPITKYDLYRICQEENLRISQVTYNNSDKEFFGNNLIVVIKKEVV